MRSVVGTHLLLLFSYIHPFHCLAPQDSLIQRREVISQLVGAAAATVTPLCAAADEEQDDITFRTQASGRQEYTNSITASRDTNISPAEAYDVIRAHVPMASNSKSNNRALDLGAGAGLSTQVLYDMGYKTIDAVDWSADAWQNNVVQIPDSVRFFEADDDAFLKRVQPAPYDVIVYNFAVNQDKAAAVARKLLKPKGLLLAPCNDRRDYWYKQSYFLLTAKGEVAWKSEADVGAWSVQFQPDVTSPTCTGIWCGSFNGFQQKKIQ